MAEDELTEAYRSLYRKGATDGLPIIPPTEERVEEMLQGTDLPRDETLGRLGNREGELTVERLGINAVMAGCLPVHMPVLVAGARALDDPMANAIQSSISTGSWAYFFLVNGPIREEIDIFSDTGAFGPNYRSNRAISRALGLAYKNVADIQPGEKDMGIMGNPFKFQLLAGENEERSPWEPYHVEQGFDATESTITLSAPNSFVQHVMPSELDEKGVLADMVYNTPPNIAGVETESFNVEAFHALCPYNAQELKDYSKREIKEYIYENSHIPAQEYGIAGGNVASEPEGIPPLQRRQFESPEQINLIVVGGSGRVDAILGPTIGGPVTKAINLPDNWDELRERYEPHLERDWGITR